MEVLKKKISTFRSVGGKVRNVSDELLMEILLAWEQWTGPIKAFYTTLGVSQRKMASILGKAKKLKREGHFPAENFKEIKIAEGGGSFNGQPCSGIEISWTEGKVIRFNEVDQLVDFLKKVA